MGGQFSLQMPDGSWQGSAVNPSFDPNTGLLTTYLKACDGSLKRASIVATYGMILENDDGKFKVVKKGEYDSASLYSDERPAGNWSETATDVTFIDSVLSANLRRVDGSYSYSSIVVFEGMSVENQDGCFVITKKSRDNAFVVKKQPIQLPLGSWIQSARSVKASRCKNIITITADLKDENGNWKTCTYKYADSTLPVLGNNNGSFNVDLGNCYDRIDSF